MATYKTGDICPIGGKWRLEESGEIFEIYKNDKFPTFQQKRAHFVLIKEIPGLEERPAKD